MKKNTIIILDILSFIAAMLGALSFFYLLKYGRPGLEDYLVGFWWLPALSVLVRYSTFQTMKIYQLAWRYASIKELIGLLKAIFLSSVLIMAVLFLTLGNNFPSSIMLIDLILNIVLLGGFRFSIRVFKDAKIKPLGEIRKKILIVGAGDAGEMLVREILRSPSLGFFPVGYVDDNPSLLGQLIHQVEVLGKVEQIPEIVKNYQVDEIIIAVPSASSEQIQKIVRYAEEAKVPFKITPPIFELKDASVRLSQVRGVNIEDLLGREPNEVNLEEIASYLSGARVLVTGAGGSIGAELSRQIAEFQPDQLILLGRGEASIYQIEMDLKKKYPYLNLLVIIGDIRFKTKMEAIFKKFRPEVVFHTAAHKHVPLMEVNPDEAILNNVVGTKNLVDLADQYNAKRFVLISTDKAVNPTNVMGASKKIAEMIVQAKAKHSPTTFVAVRFGNVLDSRGSVIPLFRKQIAEGGPVTVTHPKIVRYFMTIKEAAQLSIQAAAYGRGGEIFILDMGRPIKILDLAKELIKLAGFEIGKDMSLQFIGLRPGEKLYEELLTAEEGLKSTSHKKIFIGRPEQIEEEKLIRDIRQLEQLAINMDEVGIREKLKEVVPNYRPLT